LTDLTAGRRALALGWAAALAVAIGVRLWNALAGPRMWGYDAWGHVSYALFLDVYRAVPWADQGWSYFHPPLHYALGWALAQFGSADVLMRGLALLGSAASLSVALLAAWLVRRATPDRPGLALIGFAALAFLPVHLFTSPMPGNQMTFALLAAAGLCAFVANDSRARPTLQGDAGVGALLGLALLTNFGGLIPLLAVCAAIIARALLTGRRQRASPRSARAMVRIATIVAFAFALSMPFYQRNIAAFGDPFQLSRDYPLVAQVEREQQPGTRSWLDYVRVSPRLFRDPDPRAPHMLHSVWGTVYADAWGDLFRETDVERALERRATSGAMALAGLIPSSLALAGAWLAVRDVRRGRRREIYVVVLLQAALSLAAFAVFSWRVPIWSALKSSYLLGLSLPWAVLLARGFEGLASRSGSAWRSVPALILVATAGLASLVNLSGALCPRRADAPAAAAVHFYFGEYEAARRIYGRLVAGSRHPIAWLDNLAAVELAQGRAPSARRLYARAVAVENALGMEDDYRSGQLAVATALAGELDAARAILDAVLIRADLPELRANRGAIRARQAGAAEAERDLRDALAKQPDLVPAWLNLAAVAEGAGRREDARAARARAARAACTPPRGYPHGIGNGEVLEWGVGRRWLLLIGSDGALAPALPVFFREACRRLEGAS
jgi:tetratricopeptide (TPR) repeat protein